MNLGTPCGTRVPVLDASPLPETEPGSVAPQLNRKQKDSIVEIPVVNLQLPHPTSAPRRRIRHPPPKRHPFLSREVLETHCKAETLDEKHERGAIMEGNFRILAVRIGSTRVLRARGRPRSSRAGTGGGSTVARGRYIYPSVI